ncbi:MAG: hypothetical protein QM811_21055 [Pirellulales bacterium]
MGVDPRAIDKQLVSLKRSQSFDLTDERRDVLIAHLSGGKTYMDQIRANISAMLDHDAELLDDKIVEINRIRIRDYVLVCVALLIGVLMRWLSFVLFDRGIVRRVNRLTENVALIEHGEPLRYPPAKKDDAVGLLEQAIVKLVLHESTQTFHKFH